MQNESADYGESSSVSTTQCRITARSTIHQHQSLPTPTNLASGGVGCIQFYEGVKDFVGKDGMFIVKVVAGRMFNVYMEPFHGVKMSHLPDL